MDSQVIIEPDIIGNEKKRYCQSCLSLSDWHNQSGVAICHTCGQPLNRNESLPDAKKGQDEPAKPEPLTLQEMSENTSKAKKAFEALEKQLDKIRQQKFQALEAGATEKVIEFSQEDTRLSAELDKAFNLWQFCKKNFEYAAQDSENRILSEAKLKEHLSKIDERSVNANILLNFCSELNAQIDLALDASLDFKGIQQKGLSEAERFCMELKRNHIARIGEIEVQQISEDNIGSIVPVKRELGKEATLLENNLSKVEGIILNIRKAIFPSLLRRGD